MKKLSGSAITYANARIDPSRYREIHAACMLSDSDRGADWVYLRDMVYAVG